MLSEEILKIAASALDNKKAEAITALKVDELTSLTEYFLIATAASSAHVRALTDEVEEKLSEKDVLPHHIEGRSTGWIVLDYGDVIIHIFTAKEREFYGLDRMWADAAEVDIKEIFN